MEVINWKENREVETICFEIRIPMKKPKNIYGIFLRQFPNIIIIYIWIQQFYFGRKQKYLRICFYTMKKQLKNRAIDK